MWLGCPDKALGPDVRPKAGGSGRFSYGNDGWCYNPGLLYTVLGMDVGVCWVGVGCCLANSSGESHLVKA